MDECDLPEITPNHEDAKDANCMCCAMLQQDCSFVEVMQNPSIHSYVEIILLGLLIVFSFYYSIIRKEE